MDSYLPTRRWTELSWRLTETALDGHEHLRAPTSQTGLLVSSCRNQPGTSYGDSQGARFSHGCNRGHWPAGHGVDSRPAGPAFTPEFSNAPISRQAGIRNVTLRHDRVATVITGQHAMHYCMNRWARRVMGNATLRHYGQRR